MHLKLLLLAAAGGAIGSAARYLVNIGSAAMLGMSFPWGTLIVNIAGSFVMGLVIALAALKLTLPNEMRVFIVTGILGGFTTFSAFSLDFAVLFERKDYGIAALYVASSVGLSLLAIFAGLYLVRTWLT